MEFQEDSDYLSQEILNNIQSFFAEIGKRMDAFRKNIVDMQLKQEVEKAKAADANDEALDQTNDELEVISRFDY